MSASSARDAVAPMDRAVALVLATRLVLLLAAPVTLWLVATARPLREQGPYFIFWNVQALTQLMELGIGGLIVQFASHESPLLTWDAHGGLVGDPAARARVFELLKEGRRWYGRIALGFLLPVGAGGAWLLHTRASGLEPGPVLPWLVTVTCTAAYLPLVPFLCSIEGCGGLLRVQRMRLFQVLAAVAVLWIVLLRWGALWAVAGFALSWLAVAWGWLTVAHSRLLAEARLARRSIQPEGRTRGARAAGLSPVQWRTGASWLAMWAAPQALTPIVLASQGAAAAGQVGMSLAIATAPLTLASAWLQGRYPRYGALIARGAVSELGRVARMATLQAMCVSIAVTAAATTVMWLLSRSVPSLAARALPPAAVALLGVANLAWLLMQSLASYLRAWREEPLMEVAILGAALVTLGTLVMAFRVTPLGTVAAYVALVTLGMLPLAVLGFRRHRRASG